MLIGIGLIVLFAAAGYFGYKAFFGSPDPEPIEVPVPGPPPERARAETAPGRLVQQAAEAAEARVEPAAAVEAVIEAEPAVEAPPPVAAPRPEPAAPPPVARPLEPSVAFQAWVSGARISGVRGGAQARAFINGRLVARGDTVNADLGIVFEGVNSEQNILVFKDDTGATVGRKF